MDTNHHTSGINPKYKLKGKKQRSLDFYLDGLKQKNRFILSECITLLESNHPDKRRLSEEILQSTTAQSNTSIRVGITGSPGVGKSTFIESFGLFLISAGYRPAVMAIDPSSQISKGSILGDKTRMQNLSTHPDGYVRPSPSGQILGGIAAYTKEAIQLCEAAGFDFIIIETVGVGQSETEVDNITDVNILLLQPGAGDDIQGIKRGIVENADIFIINKADGLQKALANQTKMAYKNATQLFHHEIAEWICPVILVSALEKVGLDEVLKAINNYLKILNDKDLLSQKRKQQELKWFEKQALLKMKEIIFENQSLEAKYKELLNDMNLGITSATSAVLQFETFFRAFILKNK